MYTAISRKVVGESVHATTPKGSMGYDQYTVPDTVAVLTHAHWERYYLTTGYRLFSQHPVEDRRTIWALG